MDKIMLAAGTIGLAWSLGNINHPTKVNVGVAVVSIIVMNVAIHAMLNEHQQKESSMLLVK